MKIREPLILPVQVLILPIQKAAALTMESLVLVSMEFGSDALLLYFI